MQALFRNSGSFAHREEAEGIVSSDAIIMGVQSIRYQMGS